MVGAATKTNCPVREEPVADSFHHAPSGQRSGGVLDDGNDSPPAISCAGPGKCRNLQKIPVSRWLEAQCPQSVTAELGGRNIDCRLKCDWYNALLECVTFGSSRKEKESPHQIKE